MRIHDSAYSVHAINIAMIRQPDHFNVVFYRNPRQFLIILFLHHALVVSEINNITGGVYLQCTFPKSGFGTVFNYNPLTGSVIFT